MHDINFIEAVAERDIDLLLLEELHCSTNFRTWFAARAFADLAGANFVGAWHSVTHPHLGESDLILILEDNKRRKRLFSRRPVALQPFAGKIALSHRFKAAAWRHA